MENVYLLIFVQRKLEIPYEVTKREKTLHLYHFHPS